MSRSYGVLGAALAAVAVLLLAGPAHAQQLQALRIAEINGQMDFWLPAPRRPDTDFTNGTSIQAVFDGAPLWGHLVSSALEPCRTRAVDPHQRCATTELQVGQDIFTPATSTTRSSPQPGVRAYAGWLYAALTARSATLAQSDALTVELGATGSPSLAEKIQTAWHHFIGYPRPLGWSHQIPFEPGVLVAYDHQQEILRATIANVPVLSIVPHATLSIGNVLTGMSAGVDGRIGYRITTPWSATVRGRARPFEVFAVSSLREDLVAYQLVLDGGTTRPTHHVERQPWVSQYEFGGGVRWGPAELEYRAITRTQEYRGGRSTQPRAMILAGLRW